jgi:hypothetical protein
MGKKVRKTRWHGQCYLSCMHYKIHTAFARFTGLLGLCGWLFTGSLSNAQDTQSVSLAWDASTEQDIAGYRIHYGTTSGVYTTTLDVGNTSEVTISNLPTGNTYFFVVSAYSTASLESLPSNEASFAAEPAVIRGAYSGATISGADAYVGLSVSKKGRFSGRIVLGGIAYRARGQFDSAGEATLHFLAPDNTLLSVALKSSANGDSVTATLTHGTEITGLTLQSRGYSKGLPAPQQGKYTVLLEGTSSPSELPEGAGFAVLSVAKSGNVRLVGRLADGQSFSVKSFLAQDGSFPIYAFPYRKGKGVLLGNVTIRELAGVSDGDGTLQWVKLPDDQARFYPEGHEGTLSVAVSRFQKTSLSQDALRTAAVESSRATLSGGDLAGDPIQKDIAFPSGNSVVVLNPAADQLALSINPRNGLVRGSFTHSAIGKKRPVSGVLFQKLGTGGGFFAGDQTTGRFELIDIPTVAAE